jgi:hypothetical protein
MDLGRQDLDSEAWISVHFRMADWIIGRDWLRESTVVIIALVLYSFTRALDFALGLQSLLHSYTNVGYVTIFLTVIVPLSYGVWKGC